MTGTTVHRLRRWHRGDISYLWLRYWCKGIKSVTLLEKKGELISLTFAYSLYPIGLLPVTLRNKDIKSCWKELKTDANTCLNWMWHLMKVPSLLELNVSHIEPMTPHLILFTFSLWGRPSVLKDQISQNALVTPNKNNEMTAYRSRTSISRHSSICCSHNLFIESALFVVMLMYEIKYNKRFL